MKPHKNLGRLLEAFASLTAELPHDLVLVGRRRGFLTGDPEIGRRAEALGERVRFTGFVETGELRPTVAGATALVLPSLYEGFGLPALEAMACGRPVLAARAGALPEVCADAALYCDPRDPRAIAHGLRRLATEPELAGRLVAAGRKRARQFSWDETARSVAAAIRRLVGEGRAG